MKKLVLVIILLTSLFISNLFAKDLSTTPYKRLNKFFDEGGIPKNIELTGWFSGRCFRSDNEWLAYPSLIAFSSCKGDNEQLFPEGKRIMIGMMETPDKGSNYFDELEKWEIEYIKDYIKRGIPFVSEMREGENFLVSNHHYVNNTPSIIYKLRERKNQLLLKVYPCFYNDDYICYYSKRINCK